MRAEKLKFRYLLSLPERALRAMAAGLGGLIFELGEIALPRWLRQTRLYQALIYRLLRLSVELVGDVQGVMPPDEIAIGDLATRKAVGNVIELVSFVAVGWSPLWLLAAVSDLTGGTRAYFGLLVQELQKDGLLAKDADIQTVDELLDRLGSSSGMAADFVDVPPLNLRDLNTSWQLMKSNAGQLPGPDQLSRLFRSMQQVSRQEGRSLGDLSALIASGALRAGVQMGDRHILAYYQEALEMIGLEGWGRYARRVARPYLFAGRSHFDPNRLTYTDKALERLSRRNQRG
jgi:hypothetical protein